MTSATASSHATGTPDRTPAGVTASGLDAALSDQANSLRQRLSEMERPEGATPATAQSRLKDRLNQRRPAPQPTAAAAAAPLAPTPPAPLTVEPPAAAAPTVAAAQENAPASPSGRARKAAAPTEPAALPAPVGPRKRRGSTAAVPQAEAKPEAAPTPADPSAPAEASKAEPAATVQTLQPPAIHKLAKRGEMWLALLASKRAIMFVGWFSCAINILMMAGPLFMLQVYDRVMSSGSMPTLLALLALTLGVYAVIGLLEFARSRLVTRIGTEIDQRIGDRIFDAAMKSSLLQKGAPSGALRDLDTLRNFVAGPAPMTFFDVWWSPIYLLVIFLTHWTLGLSALFGCAILLFTAYLSDTRSRAPLNESQKAAVRSMEMAETGQRNAEAIAAMGMIGPYRLRWQKLNQGALEWQMYASDVLGTISSTTKALRLLLQSVMLAIGAALAVKGEISSGAIIAATIIFGRALAPVEQVITHWRSSIKAYDAYTKLEELLAKVPASSQSINLPAPKAHLEVQNLRVAAPGQQQLILNGINFEVKPGQMTAVIGPSASGKSTLTRALVGLWPAVTGAIKLDGVEISRWDSEQLGRHIGYLPQDMELFSGTVRENIARFRPDARDEDVIAAATAAHAHELVMSLPNGYATELGTFGTHLSGGQRQRIALARALFGNPALVVLDEANANLDRAGDVALAHAIDGMRKRGQAIVFVSHRVQAIQQADTLLFIEKGVQKAFGPRDQVLAMINGQGQQVERRQTNRPQPPQATQPTAKTAGAPIAAPAATTAAPPPAQIPTAPPPAAP